MKKLKQKKPRNHIAKDAITRRGAGKHKDKRDKRDKRNKIWKKELEQK